MKYLLVNPPKMVRDPRLKPLI